MRIQDSCAADLLPYTQKKPSPFRFTYLLLSFGKVDAISIDFQRNNVLDSLTIWLHGCFDTSLENAERPEIHIQNSKYISTSSKICLELSAKGL